MVQVVEMWRLTSQDDLTGNRSVRVDSDWAEVSDRCLFRSEIDRMRWKRTGGRGGVDRAGGKK